MATLSLSRPVPRSDRDRTLLFAVFFASGFCGLLYQVVWLRMAFAHFGVVTPVVSVVVSVFMLGLGVGSLAAGRWGPMLCDRLRISPVAVYGIAELLIGLGAVAAPLLMVWGEKLLLATGTAGSTTFLLLSGVAITVAILPWCVLMGTTYPLMMGFLRKRWPGDERGFSFLYRANVVGAAAGTLISACVLIELLGFRMTSLVAAAANFGIAAVSLALARRDTPAWGDEGRRPATKPIGIRTADAVILFVTGFSSLGMEVVWTRAFTVILRTSIYSFALILFTYLVATALGAALYRRRVRSGRVPDMYGLLLATAAAACLPAVIDDPRIQASALGVLLSIAPFCFVLGILTPKVIDAASGGDPARAGRAYATNILGSIVGPLVAGYGLLTAFDPRICLLLLALPLIGLTVIPLAGAGRRPGRLLGVGAVGVFALVAATTSRSYEEGLAGSGPHVVHRDHVATAIALGTGMDKRLLVNGIGITKLTPITKIMAHMPLALHGHAQDGLVICFGMGTTMRSMASWGIDTTAVDLTGSVMRAFPFFHADADAVLARPNVHLVIDDGRRYLARTDRSFDVIAIDPPPPVVAAGSSLLYSREMYEVLKRRLKPGGILQQWFPSGEKATQDAVARTLAQSFPYVAAFPSIEGWGVHFLASMQPIPDISTETFVERLPDTARADLLEWGPEKTPEAMAHAILSRRVPLADIVPDPQGQPTITDDRPFNEYFLMRTVF